MRDVILRLINEYDRLGMDIVKLEIFIKEYDTDDSYNSMCVTQLNCMHSYRDVLRDRITYLIENNIK